MKIIIEVGELWALHRNAKATADRTDPPLNTRIWDVIAHPLDPIQDIADTTSRKGIMKRAQSI